MMIFLLVKEKVWKLLRNLAFQSMFAIGINTIHLIFPRQIFWWGIMMVAIWIAATNYHTVTGALVLGIRKLNVIILILRVPHMQRTIRQTVNIKRMLYDMIYGNYQVDFAIALPFSVPKDLVQMPNMIWQSIGFYFKDWRSPCNFFYWNMYLTYSSNGSKF